MSVPDRANHPKRKLDTLDISAPKKFSVLVTKPEGNTAEEILASHRKQKKDQLDRALQHGEITQKDYDWHMGIARSDY